MKSSAYTTLAKTIRSFFSEHLPLTRGLSPQTVCSYRDSFILLLRFLSAHHECGVVDLDLHNLGPEDLIAFLDHLELVRGNSAATRNVRLAAVHSFARFVAIRNPEYVESSQRLLAVPIKRCRTQPVEYLEEDELSAILKAVDRRKPDGHRDYTMFLTLFNTGARVQELLDIRPIDLQLEPPYLVRLHGKGRKERTCPLWTETVESLQTLLSSSPVGLAETSSIFRNHRGEPMTRFGVRYILRRHTERAKASTPSLAHKRVHPHTYRHSAAVHLLRAGVDLVTISHWLGHASVETTNRYAVVDLETKREALERAGPVSESPNPDIAAWRSDASILDWLERL